MVSCIAICGGALCCDTSYSDVKYALGCFCFFFFKRKTSYERRIRDWSSDVCSSDLGEEKALTPQIKRPEFGRPQETPHVVSGGLPVDLRNRAAQRFVQPGHVDGDVIISRPGTGLDEGIAQEGQIERYSLGDIPGEIEPVPTLEETPA